MTRAAVHVDRALRLHRQQYRIDGQNALRSLARALETLEENEEPVLTALDRIGATEPTRVALTMRTALRLLVEGPSGEFR